ncbi:unnamed protein product, partial [Agarophyton chilense]
LLAARTALLSARRNARLPPNASFVLLTSPSLSPRVVRAVVRADAIIHYNLMSSSSSSPLLALFALNFSKLIYIAPYSLVVSPLAPLLSCVFCAPVTKPCAFSTNLLVLTPSARAHAHLRRLAHPSSNVSRLCAAHPHPHACILNRFIPLHHAPLFSPSSFSSSVAPSPASHPMRLPPAITIPHYLYYPRLRWELAPHACGPQTIIDFSSPPFTRPTNIITLVLLHLNRQWYRYRSQLHHVRTANPFTHIAAVLAFLAAMLSLHNRAHHLHPSAAAFRAKPLAVPPLVPHDLLIFAWLASAFALNAMCWWLSVRLTNLFSSVELAVLFLLLNKTVCSSAAYAALAAVFMRFATPDDALPAATSAPRPAVTAVVFSVLEAVAVVALVYATNALPAETGFRRLQWLLISVAIYFVFWVYVMILLFATSLAAGASSFSLSMLEKLSK